LVGEAIPLSELVELATVHGYFHGLLLHEVRWLEFLLLRGVGDYGSILIIIVEADTTLPVEEVNVV
jgi:hypothetical protein